MAATQGDLITIDSAAFTKFKAELDGIVKGLDDIGTALGAVELKFKKISFKNIGLKELNDMLVQINGFRGVGNTKKFDALSRVLDTLIAVSDKAKKLDPKAFAVVGQFFRAFATITAQIPPATKGSVTDRFKDLKPLIEQIILINSGLKNINLANIAKLGGFIKDISSAFSGEPINIGDIVKFSAAMSILAPGFKALALLVHLIPDGGELVKMGQVFKNLAVAFKDLHSAFDGPILPQILRFAVVFPLLVVSLSTLFKGLALILSLVPGGETLKILGRVFQQLGTAFTDLKKTFDGSILKSLLIFGVIVPIFTTAMFILLKGIAAVLSLVPGDETLKVLGRAFKQIGEAFTTLQNVFGKTSILKNLVIFGVLFPVVFTFLTFFMRGIATVLRLLPGEAALINLAAIFRQIGLAFQRLTEIFNGSTRGSGSIASSIGTIVKLAVIVPILFGVMGALFKGIASVLRAIPDGGALATLGTIFQQVGQAFKNFSTVFSGGFFQVAAQAIKLGIILPLVFGAIARAFAAITIDLVRQGAVDDFLKFTKSFRNLGEGLKALAAGSNAISLGGLIALSVKMKILAVVIKSISESAALGDNKNAEVFGTTVRSLGKGFVSLAAALKVLDTVHLNAGLLVKLVLFILTLKNIIGQVRDIAKATSASQLEAAGKLFEGVSKVLESMFTVLSSTQLNQTNIKGVVSAKDRINFIKDILNQIKGFKNVKLPDLGSILLAIPELFKAFDSQSEIPKTFKDSMRNLADGLNELKSVKIKVGDADAIAKVLTALGQSGIGKGAGITPDALISPTGSSKKAEDLGTTIANGVEKGLLSADIKKAILGVFVSIAEGIIGLFNPIRLFKGLFSGLTTLIDFAGKISHAYEAVVAKIKGVGDAITSIGNSVKSFGENILANFGAGGLVSSEAFKSAAGFEQLTTEVKTFGNLTEDETKKLRNLAFQLGKDFPLSANEALSAAKDLIKAGLDTGEIQKALPIITQLTSLTDSKDIGIAAQGIIQVVSTFQKFSKDVPAGFENAATAADILSRAADNSQASVETLIEGLGNVGPIASQFGLTLEDTASVLGIFSNAGIQGAEAGTSLKSILKTFTTDKAQNEFKKLGISITDVHGNFKSINEIITDINQSFNKAVPVYSKITGLTKDQKAQYDLISKAAASAQRNLLLYQNQVTTGALDQDTANKKIDQYKKVIANAQIALGKLTGDQKEAAKIIGEVTRSQSQNVDSLLALGGTYGAVGLSALLAAGDNGIQSFTDAMNKLPTAATRAQQLLDNFNGDVVQLSGSFDTLAVEVIEPTIATVFRPFVQVLLAITNAFVALDPEVLATVGTFLSLASILATIIGGVAVAGGTIAALGGTIISLGASLLSIQTIFFGLVEFAAGFAVGLASILVVALPLIAAGYAISKAFRTVLSIFQNNLGGAQTALERFKSAISAVFLRLKGVFSGIGNIVSAIFGGKGTADLTQAGTAISTVLNRITDKIIHFAGFLTVAKRALDAFANAINIGSLTGDVAKQLAGNPLIQLLFGLRGESSTAGNLQNLFRSIQKNIGVIRASFSHLTDVFKTFFADIGSGANLSKSIQKFISGLKVEGGKLASSVIKLFANIFKFDPSQITDQLDTGNITGAIRTVIGKVLDSLRNFLLKNRGTITDVATSIFSFVFTPGKLISTVLKVLGLDKPAAIIDDVGKAINSLFKGIVDFAFNLLSGQDIGTAFSNAFRPVGLDVANALLDAISNGLSSVGDLFHIDVSGFLDQLKAGFDPLIAALESGTGSDILAGVGTAVVTAFSVAVQTAFTGIGQLLGIDTTPLVNQIAAAFGPLAAAFQTGDPTVIFGSLATAVIQTMVTAIELGLLTLGTLFNFDAQAVIDQLVLGLEPLITSLNSGDPVQIFSGLVTAVSTAVGAAITAALNILGTTLDIDVSSITDGISTIIQNNIDAANTGGAGGAFFTVANTVVGAFTTAVETAFAGIGKLLNIDAQPFIDSIKSKFGSVVDTFKSVFTATDGTNIFDNIATVIDKLRKGFADLFSVFNPSATSGVQQAANPLDALLNFLVGLVNAGLGALQIPLTFLNNFFYAIAQITPEEAKSIVAIGTILIALAGISALATNAGALSKLLLDFKNTAAIKAGAILILIDFVNLLLEAAKKTGGIHSVGDAIQVVVDALANLGLQLIEGLGLQKVFADITNGLANIFQIKGDFTPENFINRIKTTLGQLGAITTIIGAKVQDFFTGLFRSITLGFEGLVIDAKITAQKVKNGLDLNATAGLDAGTSAIGDEFVRNAQLTPEQTAKLTHNAGDAAHDVFDFYNQVVAQGVGPFGDPVSGPLLKEKLKNDLQKNLPDVLGILFQEFAGRIAAEDPAGARKDIANAIPGLIFSGGLQDAAAAAAKTGNFNLLQTLIEESAKQGVAPADLNAMAAQVQDAFTVALASGDTTKINAARALLDNLIKNASTLGLDPVALKALKDSIDAQIAKVVGTGGTGTGDGKGTPVPVPVSVEPTVTDTAEEIQTKAREAAEKRLAEADAQQNGTGVAPVNVDVPVTTTATATQDDTDKLTISLADLAKKLLDLKTGTAETKDGVIAAVKTMADILGPFFEAAKNDSAILAADFLYLGVVSGIMAVAIGLSAASVIVSTVLMSAVLTPFLNNSAAKMLELINSTAKLGQTFLVQVPPVITAGLLLTTAITKFTTDSVSGVNKLLDKLQALSDKLTEIAGKFAAIADAKVPVPPTGGGGTGADGSQSGGGGQAGITTAPDRLYQVVEAGEPELYTAGGKTYLIPSSKGVGQVIPAINASSISGTTNLTPRAASNQPLASSSMITYNEGDISVTINGTNLNAQQIAAQVQQQIIQKQAADRKSVKDRLRTAAR